MAERDHMRHAGGDEGISLVEVLAAVTLMGIAVVAILSALGVLITSSREHRQMANAQVVLASAAEKVKATSYVQCLDPAVDTTYEGAAQTATQPSDWDGDATVEVIEVGYWVDGIGFDTDVTQCVTSSTVQQVTLRVTSPDGGNTDTVSILKAGLTSSGQLPPLNCGLSLSGNRIEWEVEDGEDNELHLHLNPNVCDRDTAWEMELLVEGIGRVTLLESSNGKVQPEWGKNQVHIPDETCDLGCTRSAFVVDNDLREIIRFPVIVSDSEGDGD